jgi:hypothetical protein
MSEPYHHTDRPLNVPDRLKNILDILKTYHQQLIQGKTLPKQDPYNTLTQLKALLAEKGDALEEFLRWRNVTPEARQDSELMACIQQLSPNLDPLHPKISVLAPRWCHLMFKDYALSIDPTHMLRLYENSGAESEGDGDS